MEREGFISLWRRKTLGGTGRLLNDLTDVARSLDIPVFIVGGYLRDMIIGKSQTKKSDIDIVIEGDAIAFAAALQNKFGGHIQIHARFGNANWFIEEIKNRWEDEDDGSFPDALDIISARKEEYRHPGALPTVFRGNIDDDIDRRDFSINTLAIRLDANEPLILDRHRALNDIRHGLIRVLHENSFRDDPTRMFRAVRYEQRYEFEMTTETLQQLNEDLGFIKSVSGDRLRHEINHILEEERMIEMLKRLDDLGVLHAVQDGFSFGDAQRKRMTRVMGEYPHPIVSPMLPVRESRQKHQRLVYTAWLSSFDTRTGQAISSRLNLSMTIRNILDGYHAVQAKKEVLQTADPIDTVEFLDTIPIESLHLARLFEENPRHGEIFRRYLEDWKHVHPEITGDDLKKMNLPPGPEYSTLFRRLRAARLNGIIHSRQEEYQFLEKILAGLNRNGS